MTIVSIPTTVLRRSAFIILLLSLLGVTTFGATFIVTNTADTNDGVCDVDCSLREAVGAANASPAADAIQFSSIFNSSQSIVLGGSELAVTASGPLSIVGPSAVITTISGNNAGRVLSVGIG